MSETKPIEGITLKHNQGKWHTADSFDGKRLLKQHLYIPAMCSTYLGKPYEGNRTACKLNGGIVDRNIRFANIETLYSEEQRIDCCKKCLKFSRKH